MENHQIIHDHSTNRSCGFGFIIFDSEEVVDDLLSEGNMIDLAGSEVSFIQLLKNDLIKIDPGLPHFVFHSEEVLYTVPFCVLEL